MKNKKIAISFLGICSLVIYLAASSFSAGIVGQSQTGCSCHGPANSATTITFTGMPTSYTPLATYTITASVNNSSMAAAGIDLTVNNGNLGGTPVGAALTALEMNHITPNIMSAGSASWTFLWTAPSTGSGITAFYVAGNAVNLNGNPNGDAYNIDSAFVPENIPSIVCASVVNNAPCFGGTGSVTATGSGGISPYTYQLGSLPTNTTGFFTSVIPGIYTLTITDFSGIMCTSTVAISQPTPFNAFTTNCTNLLCFGGTNGTVSASAFGGTPSYSYLWSPSGATTPIASGLSAGTYTVTVTDANGCTSVTNCTITQPPAITNSVSVTAASSYTLPGASIVVTSSGVYPHIYPAANGCDSTVTYNVTIGGSACILVSPKVILFGPYNTGTLLMNDQLRTLNIIPLTEPYSTLSPYNSVYAHISGGGETTTPAVLAVTGPNAIVDWVFLTIRLTPTSPVTATRAALVQRDGDVVDVDGVSPVCFNAPAGNYHVSIKHRNHLGCMTNATYALSTVTTAIDFTSPTTIMWLRPPGLNNPTPLTGARKNIGTLRTLYPGNCKVGPGFNNKLVRFGGTGAFSDRAYLISFTGTSGIIPGYTSIDCNMNGVATYSPFIGSDRSVILNSCAGSTAIFVTEQIP
jgi:hypothetical protein